MLLSYGKKDGSTVKIRVKEVTSAPPVTIGRDSTATVQVDDPKCSRVHVGVRYWEDVFVVLDMKSHNGTYLNGEKIAVAILKPGDILKIGDTEIRALTEGTRGDVTMTF